MGDIFGAPLAAEALLAFFLESVFLGILLFGRKTVSPKFYLVSAWLVWFGSCLSALWILIANSWMQTPAGAELAADGSKAVITDFLGAALNPSLMARYSHVVVALLIMGAFAAMAVSAWYLIKGRHADFAMKTMRIGAVVGIVTSCVMIFTAHALSLIHICAESDAILARAVELLCAGKILAVKGLGGFHLVCDANNADAVALLRARKRREGKAFAVMAATTDDVRRVCEVSDAEAAALEGSQRPIVLLKKRAGAAFAPGLADRLPELGVMLPYTPLQHLPVSYTHLPKQSGLVAIDSATMSG